MNNKYCPRIPLLVLTILLLLSVAPVVGAQSGGEGENENEGPGENFYCLNRSEEHPVAARLVGNFEVPYDVIMDWFCGGFGFGEIKMALQISTTAGVSPDELLQMKANGTGWGVIRKGFGLIGQPDWGDDPPGKGNRKPFKNHGRPPWAGQPGGPWGGEPPVVDD